MPGSPCVAEVFTDREWEYLGRLNEWANALNHGTYLKRHEGGVITMVCPSSDSDINSLRSVVVKTGVVESSDKLIIKEDNVSIPPRPPLSM
jgi:hypothetical protein